MKQSIKKQEKYLILFPNIKLIVLLFGDENNNKSFPFNYTKNWKKRIKFLKRKNNSSIKIIVSSKIYKNYNEFYISKDQELVSTGFEETVNLVNQLMSGS